MHQALELSKNALPDCAPNPPVGCVIAHQNTLLVNGFTKSPGNPHAEASALATLQLLDDYSKLKDLTAYVTLEPCSFVGRTPACAKTIADTGRFKRVVVAILDSDPRNNGKGIACLKAAGIQVDIGILAEEVSAFLVPYLIGKPDG
jgi:pyrimidine deaminase RibD-like protein